MRVGTALRLRNFRHYYEPSTPDRVFTEMHTISEDYRAPKGEVFVCILLGTEPTDGSAPMNTFARLNEMGWGIMPIAEPEGPA